MFFDGSLNEGGVFGEAWRKGLRQPVLGSNKSIKNICEELDRRIRCEERFEGGSRIALRTSAVLLSGVVQLYTEGLDTLFQDCMKLDDALMHRRKNVHKEKDGEMQNSEESQNNGGLRSPSEPAVRTDGAQISTEMSTSRSGESHSSECSARRKLSAKKKTKWNSSSEPGVSGSTSDEGGTDSFIGITKREIGVQTNRSYMRSRRAGDAASAAIGPLPTGVVLVYEDDDKIPRKLICSSLNPGVRLI